MTRPLTRLCLLVLCLTLTLPALADDDVSLFSPAQGDPAPQATQAPAATDVIEAETPAPSDALPPLVITEQTAAPEQPAGEEPGAVTPVDGEARAALIDRMIDLADDLYTQANGRAQKAASSGDIYVCKNFTVHLFRKNRDDFRMAAYPDVPLVIPNNLPAKDSKPYSYGIAWEDIPASEGNPFYAAHSFYYDSDQSMDENRERALEFMRQVQRGDFFQMSAQYYYGVGAHSLVFTKDYDADTNQVTWTDSNMKGESRGGVRYGWVQFDAVKEIDWFVDAFCKRGRGATLYRLRDDIIYK